jgi:hypothetical protein
VKLSNVSNVLVFSFPSMPIKMERKENFTSARTSSPDRKMFKDRNSNRPSAKLSAMETAADKSQESNGRLGRDVVRTIPNQANGALNDPDGAHTSSIVLRAIAAAKARRSARAALLQHEMLRRSESEFESGRNGARFNHSPVISNTISRDDGDGTLVSERFFQSINNEAKSESGRGTSSVVTISPIRAGGLSMHQSDLLSPAAALSPDIDFIRRLAIEDNKDLTPRAPPSPSDAIRFTQKYSHVCHHFRRSG